MTHVANQTKNWRELKDCIGGDTFLANFPSSASLFSIYIDITRETIFVTIYLNS